MPQLTLDDFAVGTPHLNKSDPCPGTYRVHYTNSKVYMFLHTTLSSSTAYICNSDDYETQEAVSCDYTSFNGYPTFSVSDGGEIHIGTIVKK